MGSNNNKDNKKIKSEYIGNTIVGVICNIVGVLILGYVFSSIAYILFSKNYKLSLDNKRKRKLSIIGQTISTFFFAFSCSYHTQSFDIPLNERIISCGIVGLIFSIIVFFVLIAKDKKIILTESNELEEYEEEKETNDEKIISTKSKNKRKNFKIKKNYFTYIILATLVISNIAFFVLYFNEKSNKESVNESNGENIILDEEYWENNLPEDCVFMLTEDVEYIEIRANSSAGVGDVFSKTVPNKKYLIYDNNIGDVIYVNYKLNGDESRYECNNDWYSVTLSDGTEGFVWGGYKGMYVKEY